MPRSALTLRLFALPRSALTLGLLALLAVPAAAQSVLKVPGQYPTVQSAIDKAGNGDTVLVAPGVYPENIDFKGKGITVRSEKGAALTTLDGGKRGSVVSFRSGEPKEAVLDGFTITNGTGSYSSTEGGGIYISAAAAPTIRNNWIVKNTVAGPYGRGAGIYCDQLTAPAILDNVIRDNYARVSGGALHSDVGTPIVRGNRIENNQAEYGGAGIFGLSGSLHVQGNTFRGNVSTIYQGIGGALYFQQGSISILDNVFEGNKSLWGGAAFLNSGVNSHIEGNTVFDNEAENGGGLCLAAGQHDVIGNVIRNNRSPNNGNGGGICNVGGTLRLESNLIHGNTAAIRGGGVYSRLAEPALLNNTIYGNRATLGGGLFVSDLTAAHPPITNGIFWANVATQSGPQIEWTGQQPTATSSDIQGGWPGAGNLNLDPRFVDPSADDLHLLAASPCVDRGAAAAHLSSRDFEGDPRAHPTAVDIGADELHPHLYVTGSRTPGGTIDVKVIGTPATDVILGIGAGVLAKPITIPGLGVLHLLPPVGLLPVGRIPATGVLAWRFKLPAAFPAPASIPLQALIGARLSNLHLLEVR